MLEVREDNAAAFEELMLRYQNRVVNLLEHLVGDRHLAEDLAQDVFLRVYRARKTYTPEAKFTTWLYTIVNNVASNALRSRYRRKEIDLQPDPGASGTSPIERVMQPGSGHMPARRLDRAEMTEMIRLALLSLSERQRMAVLLCKFEEMSYADIGQTMGMSGKAIKSLLARARVNLREVLEPYLDRGDRPGEAAHEPNDSAVNG